MVNPSRTRGSVNENDGYRTRMARIKTAGRGAVYQCICRVVGVQMLLVSPEEERLREMLWEQAEFGGVGI